MTPIDTTVIDAALLVNPFTPYVYGFLVLILIVYGIKENRDHGKTRKKYEDLLQSNLVILNSVSEKLHLLSESKDTMETSSRSLRSAVLDLDNIISRLNAKSRNAD
jgi:hypothetical protein